MYCTMFKIRYNITHSHTLYVVATCVDITQLWIVLQQYVFTLYPLHTATWFIL